MDQAIFLGIREVIWVAIQSIAAFCGLIGLIFYVEFTRRTMKAAEQTRRATYVPMLVVKGEREDQPVHHLAIVNVGGAALNASVWMQIVKADFRVGPWKLQKKPEVAEQFIGPILKEDNGPKLVVASNYLPIGGHELIVIEYVDLLGGHGQLQIIRHRIDEMRHEVEVNFVLIDASLPFLRKKYNDFRSWYALRKSIHEVHAAKP